MRQRPKEPSEKNYTFNYKEGLELRYDKKSNMSNLKRHQPSFCR